MNKYIFNPDDGLTILEPEGNAPGFWIGAPSVYYDSQLEKFYLYTRTRNPRPPKGKIKPDDQYRGYKCQIHESKDGKKFTPIWEMRKSEINARSIEQGSLVKIDGAETSLKNLNIRKLLGLYLKSLLLKPFELLVLKARLYSLFLLRQLFLHEC